jgi:hypothetical protein
MNKIRSLISTLVGLLALAALTGCNGPGPAPTDSPTQVPTTRPVETDSPLPTPQPIETDTPTPTSLPTVMPQLTATPLPFPEPQPYPTPEWAPYEDEPFTIVFGRDGEIWLSEIGGRGEWALTRERPEWGAGEFAISPDGQAIAFVAEDEGGKNICVKLVSVLDGTTPAILILTSSLAALWWDKHLKLLKHEIKQMFPTLE